MRTLFHLVWLGACVALSLAATRPPRRRVAAAGAAALLLVAGLYAKNAWLFGTPAATSWFGMNLANGLLPRYSDEDLAQLVERGVVSPLVEIAPFSPLASYPAEWTPDPGSDVPALRSRNKRGGESNYNHFAYLELSRQYGRDALRLIRHDPLRYLGMIEEAWRRYLLAPSSYELVEPNRGRLLAWDRFYDAFVYGVPDAWIGRPGPPVPRPWAERPTPPIPLRRIGWLWLAAAVAAVGHTGWHVARVSWRRWHSTEDRSDLERARLAALAFCLFNVVFVSLVANAFESGENNRFRVAIEPLVVVLIAFSASRLAARRQPERG